MLNLNSVKIYVSTVCPSLTGKMKSFQTKLKVLTELLFERPKFVRPSPCLDILHIPGDKGIRPLVVRGDKVMSWNLSEVPSRLQIAALILT